MDGFSQQVNMLSVMYPRVQQSVSYRFLKFEMQNEDALRSEQMFGSEVWFDYGDL